MTPPRLRFVLIVAALAVIGLSLLCAPWKGLVLGSSPIREGIALGPIWQAPTALYGHQPHIRAAIPESQQPRVNMPLLTGIWVGSGAVLVAGAAIGRRDKT